MTITAPQLFPAAVSDLPKSRLNLFNLVRLVLAVMVIFSHSYPLLYGPQIFDPIEHLTHAQKDLPDDHAIDGGHLAVYGFFVISGYLVTRSWQNSQGVWDYLRKRVLRICPGFFVNCLVCAVVIGPVFAVHKSTYFPDLWELKKQLFLALLLLKGIVTPPLSCGPINALNGSLWTISYEFNCYFVVALLGSAALLSRRFLPSRLRRAAPAALFIGVYTVYCLHCRSLWPDALSLMNPHLAPLRSTHWGRRITFLLELPGDPTVWSRQFVYFAAGMCLSLYRDILRPRLLLLLSVAAIAVSSFALPALAYTLPLFGSYLLISLCLLPNLPLSRIGSRTDLSYGIYLYAFPVQQLLIHCRQSFLTPTTLFLLALPCTCVAAAVSWHWIEQPLLKRKWRTRSQAR